jgi:hypothetical protein
MSLLSVFIFIQWISDSAAHSFLSDF